MALMTQDHQITITSLRSDHSQMTASGNVSNHYYGRAMDIAAVDGVSCTDTAITAPCAQLGYALAQLPAPLHPTELIYCFDLDGVGPAFALPDHCDHIHAGYYRLRGGALPSVARGSPVRPGASTVEARSPFAEGGTAMPTYVMLTNLTAEGVRTLKNNPGRVAEVNREVEQIGAKVVAQYATLGPVRLRHRSSRRPTRRRWPRSPSSSARGGR